MLEIVIPLSAEGWDEKNECFIEPKYQRLQLEHSLLSISKWESRWKKPFLSRHGMTVEETVDYIKCMTITPKVDPNVYNYITNDILSQVDHYINDPMTATTVNERNLKGGSKEVLTSELIYYYMTALNIPFECEKWHFNRLYTLIRVCNVKNQPAKKMSKKDIMSQNSALNAARRKQFNSKG